MKIIKAILLALWQLPQFLLGAVIALFARAWQVETGEWVAHASWFSGAISLSEYFRIFSSSSYPRETTRRHEYGHARQSRILGPLYLLVIGLPSLVWAALYNGQEAGYFTFYTERWADRLGGVKR